MDKPRSEKLSDLLQMVVLVKGMQTNILVQSILCGIVVISGSVFLILSERWALVRMTENVGFIFFNNTETSTLNSSYSFSSSLLIICPSM